MRKHEQMQASQRLAFLLRRLKKLFIFILYLPLIHLKVQADRVLVLILSMRLKERLTGKRADFHALAQRFSQQIRFVEYPVEALHHRVEQAVALGAVAQRHQLRKAGHKVDHAALVENLLYCGVD